MRGPVPLSSIQLPKITGCVYSKAGVGKTVLACASQHLRTFVFDIDNGMFSAKSFRGKDGFPGVNPNMVDVWENIRTKQQFFDAYSYLTKNQQQYGLCVVDTATELQKVLLDEVTGGAQARIQDWGTILNVMEALARQMRAMPMHVLWLAHEVVSENPETRRLMFRPSFQGALSREYAKHFDFIGRYCLIDQQVKGQDNQLHLVSHRFLQCQPDQVTEAKDRSGILSKFESPVLDHLLNKMLTQATQQ